MKTNTSAVIAVLLVVLVGGFSAVPTFFSNITCDGVLATAPKTSVCSHSSFRRKSDQSRRGVTSGLAESDGSLDLTFLPDQKQLLVGNIARQAELEIQEIVNSSNGFRTSADEQNIKEIQAVSSRRIQGILDDDEWRTYSERNSTVGRELKRLLGGISYFPDQFSTLFTSAQDIEEWIDQQAPETIGDWRPEGHAKMVELVEQELGPEARKKFECNSDPSFAHLEKFAGRFNLTNETAIAIYDLLNVMQSLDAQPLDMDQFPDGIDPVRAAAQIETKEQLADLMPPEVFSEFAAVWLGN